MSSASDSHVCSDLPVLGTMFIEELSRTQPLSVRISYCFHWALLYDSEIQSTYKYKP